MRLALAGRRTSKTDTLLQAESTESIAVWRAVLELFALPIFVNST
jgi:hypothetical protein